MTRDYETKAIVLEGWLLGRGVEGAGEDDIGLEWARREATIFLTSDGAVVCEHLEQSRNGAPARWVSEYESDRALLMDAARCIIAAAQHASKKCRGVSCISLKGLLLAGFDRARNPP